jgi:hypothetical protein
VSLGGVSVDRPWWGDPYVFDAEHVAEGVEVAVVVQHRRFARRLPRRSGSRRPVGAVCREVRVTRRGLCRTRCVSPVLVQALSTRDRDCRTSPRSARPPGAPAPPLGRRSAGRRPCSPPSGAGRRDWCGDSTRMYRIPAGSLSRRAPGQREACRRSETVKSYPSSSPESSVCRNSIASWRACFCAVLASASVPLSSREARISTTGSSASSGVSSSSFWAFSRVVTDPNLSARHHPEGPRGERRRIAGVGLGRGDWLSRAVSLLGNGFVSVVA